MSADLQFCFQTHFIEVEHEMVTDIFNVYLINIAVPTIHFKYTLLQKNISIYEMADTLKKDEKIYIQKINFSAINNNLKIEFKWTEDTTNTEQYFTFKFKASLIMHKISQLLLNKKNDFFIPIQPIKKIECNNNLLNAFDIKIKPQTIINHRFKHHNFIDTSKQNSQYVIDLHTEKLNINTTGLSNGEILSMQLKELEKHIDNALRINLHSIMIVHGLGKGVLRSAVHELLTQHPHIQKFNNDHHPLYGFGATEAFL